MPFKEVLIGYKTAQIEFWWLYKISFFAQTVIILFSVIYQGYSGKSEKLGIYKWTALLSNECFRCVETTKATKSNWGYKTCRTRCLLLSEQLIRLQRAFHLHNHVEAPKGHDHYLWKQIFMSIKTLKNLSSKLQSLCRLHQHQIPRKRVENNLKHHSLLTKAIKTTELDDYSFQLHGF